LSKRSEDALIALRRIQRVTEMASKRLARTAGLNPSQLSVLRILTEYPEVSAGYLAEATQLKHATITQPDRQARGAWPHLSPQSAMKTNAASGCASCHAGKAALANAPDPLHETFSARFDALPDWQQAMLIASLEQVTSLLDAQNIEAAPVLDIGELDNHDL
jgi:hypothetical protein